METITPIAAYYDVVVVGSGIAGLYAALLASSRGSVLMVTKGALQESNTRYAQGGIAVALGPHDSPELHLRDTIAAGDGLCDPTAVSILTSEAPDCILDLLYREVPFDREAGDLARTLEAAHSAPRVLHAGGDATGASIERVLSRAIEETNITVREGTLCTSVLTHQGRVHGVRLLAEDGGYVEVRAPTVILASGGAGQLFSRTTNPPVATGDGLALAYRAGAQLTDLEFMQFHPTALALDGAPAFLISEAVRGEGGILRDLRGRPFMEKYHPDRELAPRDVVARAVHHQMQEAGTPHVLLDMTHLPKENVERRFPNIVRFCRRHDIDPVREPIPVAPAAHYYMGGVRTDSWGRTSLPGLLACGEVACTGVHGANRLASNSLLEGLVFARRAVHAATSDVFHEPMDWTSGSPLSRAPVFQESRYISVATDHERAKAMWRWVGLIRSRDSLAAAQTMLSSQVADDSTDRDASVDEYQRANLALISRLLVASALLREESRGAHYREDFPTSKSDWWGRIVVSKSGTHFVSPASGVAQFPVGLSRGT